MTWQNDLNRSRTDATLFGEKRSGAWDSWWQPRSSSSSSRKQPPDNGGVYSRSAACSRTARPPLSQLL